MKEGPPVFRLGRSGAGRMIGVMRWTEMLDWRRKHYIVCILSELGLNVNMNVFDTHFTDVLRRDLKTSILSRGK